MNKSIAGDMRPPLSLGATPYVPTVADAFGVINGVLLPEIAALRQEVNALRSELDDIRQDIASRGAAS